MQKLLLFVMAVVGAAWVGYKIGDVTAARIKVQVISSEGPKQPVVLKDAGALDGESSCELSWAYCWRRT
jgi:hypothetical protein